MDIIKRAKEEGCEFTASCSFSLGKIKVTRLSVTDYLVSVTGFHFVTNENDVAAILHWELPQ